MGNNEGLRRGIALVVLLGSGAVGGLLICKERTGDDEVNPIFKPVSAVQVRELLEKEGAQQLLGRYLTEHGDLENIFSTPFALGHRLGSLDKETTQLIQRQSYEHLINGLYLDLLLTGSPEAQQQLNTQPRIFGSLNYGEMILDLNNPLEFHLAAALIKTKLEIYQQNLRGLPIEIKLEKENENLQWLAKEKPTIKMIIEPGSFALIPSEVLAEMSENLQMLKTLNVPYPREIRFKVAEATDPGGAWYDDHADPVYPYRITVTNLSPKGAFDHEIAHHVANSWRMPENTNPQLFTFSNESFYQMLERIKQKYGAQEKIIKAKNEVEEYAEAFVRYYSKGNGFRQAILAAADGSIQKEVLRGEYEFMKAVWKRKEFRFDRQLVEYLDPAVPIQIGDVLKITDTDLDQPGILLRPSPTLAISAGLPAVWDENRIQIIGGPVTILDPNRGTIRMWQVIVGSAYEERFYTGDNPKRFPEGWISQEWFGPKIPIKN